MVQVAAPDLKSRVREHIEGFMTPAELEAHATNTDSSIDSQKEFLKRVIVERAPNPLAEVDTIKVVNDLDEKSICPFINGHMARDY